MATKKYPVKIGDREYQFTAHDTILGARLVLHPCHNPRIVRLADGWYDAYPPEYPLPPGAEVVEECVNGKYVAVNGRK